jgi:hypothetical protein
MIEQRESEIQQWEQSNLFRDLEYQRKEFKRQIEEQRELLLAQLQQQEVDMKHQLDLERQHMLKQIKSQEEDLRRKEDKILTEKRISVGNSFKNSPSPTIKMNSHTRKESPKVETKIVDLPESNSLALMDEQNNELLKELSRKEEELSQMQRNLTSTREKLRTNLSTFQNQLKLPTEDNTFSHLAETASLADWKEFRKTLQKSESPKVSLDPEDQSHWFNDDALDEDTDFNLLTKKLDQIHKEEEILHETSFDLKSNPFENVEPSTSHIVIPKNMNDSPSVSFHLKSPGLKKITF